MPIYHSYKIALHTMYNNITDFHCHDKNITTVTRHFHGVSLLLLEAVLSLDLELWFPDAAVLGRDSALPGLDTADLGRDTAEPGLDEAVPGLDIAVLGLDTALPGLDPALSGLDLLDTALSGRRWLLPVDTADCGL